MKISRTTQSLLKDKEIGSTVFVKIQKNGKKY